MNMENFHCSSATFGFVRNPNGESYAIDWTDFHLANIAEDQQSIAPKALNFQFTGMLAG